MSILDALRSYKDQVKMFLYRESEALAYKFEPFLVPSSPDEFAIFNSGDSESYSSSGEDYATAATVRRNFRVVRDLYSKATAGFADVWKSAFKACADYLKTLAFFSATAVKAVLWTGSALASLRLLVVYPFTVAVGGGLMYMFGNKELAKSVVQKATANLVNEINIISTVFAVGFLLSVTPFVSSSLVTGTLFSTVGLSALSIGSLGVSIWRDQIKERLPNANAHVTAANVSGLKSASTEQQLEHEQTTKQLSAGGAALQSSLSASAAAADTQAALEENKRRARFAGGVLGVFFSPSPLVGPSFAAVGAAVAEEALNKYRQSSAATPTTSL